MKAAFRPAGQRGGINEPDSVAAFDLFFRADVHTYRQSIPALDATMTVTGGSVIGARCQNSGTCTLSWSAIEPLPGTTPHGPSPTQHDEDDTASP
jgi:hypothetical protein